MFVTDVWNYSKVENRTLRGLINYPGRMNLIRFTFTSDYSLEVHLALCVRAMIHSFSEPLPYQTSPAVQRGQDEVQKWIHAISRGNLRRLRTPENTRTPPLHYSNSARSKHWSPGTGPGEVHNHDATPMDWCTDDQIVVWGWARAFFASEKTNKPSTWISQTKSRFEETV